MATQSKINWLGVNRSDMPDFESTKQFYPKTSEEIMNDMVASFHAYTGREADMRPGSIIGTLFSIFAEQLVSVQINMSQAYPGVPGWNQPPTPQTWVYPDGTKSTTKPKDSDTFRKISPDGSKEDCWIWYDSSQNWKWIGAKILAPIKFAPITIHIGNVEELKCECGSEKSGSNKHSDWCKKYDPNA